MNTHRIPYVSAALLLFVVIAASAQTIIVPEPERPVQRFEPPYIQETHVAVEIEGTLAKTTVELIVFNPGARIAEGTLLFPLPKNASVSDFYLWIEGNKTRGELLDKAQAAQIFRDIVNRMKDPALLEMTRHNIFKASIFPIEANKSRKISITYSESLSGSTGLLQYTYLMKDRQTGTPQPQKSFSFEASINAPTAITAAYSPSHDVDISRSGSRSLRAGFEKQNYRPERDLHLYMGYSAEDMAVHASRYSAPGVDRDFAMFLLAPSPQAASREKVAKDVIFVLDTSGSMNNDQKIEQALSALKFGLATLDENDRFALLTFATSVRSFAPSLLSATPDNTGKATAYLDSRVSATGSTNIHDALLKAFAFAKDESRPRYIIFLTDGLPTAVERDPQKIIEKAGKKAPAGIRLFTWGVGYDVDTILLDTLAGDNGGVSEYVKPREEMESKLGSFFEKISHPVMTNVSIEFEGMNVEEMYPRELPDFFKGSQLTLFARMSGGEQGEVILSGNYLGDQRQFRYQVKPMEISDGGHIAHLWAARKVGFLLEEIRAHGESAELKEAVIDLAQEYGIVTPYTSYLVTEPEEDMIADTAAAPADQREARTAAGEPAYAMDAQAAPSGKAAVERSQEIRKLKEETTAGESSGTTRRLDGKTFRLVDGIWTDSEFDKTMKLTEVTFGSSEYFKLLEADPRMPSWLAISAEMIIVVDGKAYKITS